MSKAMAADTECMTANTSTPGVEALRAQQESGALFLRFEPELERCFQEYYRESGRIFRLVLLCLGCLTVLGTPVFNELLQAPESFRYDSVLVLYGLQIPAFAIAIVATVLPRWRRYSDIVLAIAALVLAVGFLLERAIGANYGFDMPLEFIGVIVVAVFFIARLRFRLFLPAALAMTAIMILNEALLVGSGPEEWYRIVAMLLLISVAFVGGYSQEYLARTAWLEHGILQHMSTHDGLTGLLNRRAAEETIERGLRQAARHDAVYSVAMIDLDYFKNYNDAYGHASGDELLCHLADMLRGVARRPQDCIGRLGGEEFVVAWYDADPDEIVVRAEELRRKLEASRPRDTQAHPSTQVTMSIGLVTLRPDRHTRTDAVIRAADRLLYRAKDEGRNRTVVEHW